jgi:hypothetical protein
MRLKMAPNASQLKLMPLSKRRKKKRKSGRKIEIELVLYSDRLLGVLGLLY